MRQYGNDDQCATNLAGQGLYSRPNHATEYRLSATPTNLGTAVANQLEVRSPYSGELLASLEAADLETAQGLVKKARRLADDRKAWMPAHERAAVLRRMSALVSERHEELAMLVAKEGGKPLVDARVEITRAAGGLLLCAEEATRLGGQQIPMEGSAAAMGRWAFTVREPIGVVLAFSAFNHPFNLVVHQAGPAIAAGCPVLMKPAPATPLSALKFGEIAKEAGLPEGWCQVLVCDNGVAGELAKSRDIDFFSFIGNAGVGWSLRSGLGPGVRCALEHGGAAPVVVDASADLDLAVPLLLKGGFYHAGQVCVSVQRVFAHESIARELGERLLVGANKLVVGDPCLAQTEVGPLIRRAEGERVIAWIQEAVAQGVDLLCGGAHLPGNCVSPAVLWNPPLKSKVMEQEVFGPVVCVRPVKDMAQAIQEANAVPWNFQAAVFAQDIGVAIGAADALKAAAVMVNDHTAFRVDWMPFGGHGPSGLGVGGIGPAARELTHEKLVVLRK